MKVKIAALLLALSLVVGILTADGLHHNSSAEITVLMYHHLTENPSNVSEYTALVTDFEKDLRYLSRLGYRAIGTGELLGFLRGKNELPEKSVVITFDDGFESVAVLGAPILEKYGMSAVCFLLGEECDRYSETEDHNISYSYLGWDTVGLLSCSGTLEMQCHTYSMHKLRPRRGCSKMQGESDADYQRALTEDIDKFQQKFYEHTSKKANAIALPYGSYCDETLKYAADLGFEVIFTCTEKVNTLKAGDALPLILGRYNRSGNLSTEEFLKKCDLN